MAKIFISHSWSDKAIAKKLVYRLEQLGCEVWIDHENTVPGDNLFSKINEGLEWCDTFLLLWSDSAKDSDFVRREISSAMNVKKRIITCLIDKTNPPSLLAGEVYIDFNNFDQAFLKLCNTMAAIDIDSTIMKKIYVSSTIEDLSVFRSAVRNEIERLGHIFIGTEILESIIVEATRLHHKEIASCDLFIGVYAHRYGFVPPEEQKSIIEQEYDLAQHFDKSCFIYFLDDDVAWKPKYIDRWELGQKLDQFKTKIKTKQNFDKFDTAYQLATKISERITSWMFVKKEETSETIFETPEDIIEKYRRIIRNDYSILNVLDRKRTFPIEHGYIPLSLKSKNNNESQQFLDAKTIVKVKNMVLIIIGAPGTGKTTLLQYMAFAESSNDKGLCPIYVRLSRFGITGDDLEEYLYKEIGLHLSHSEKQKIVAFNMLKNERCIVLLDGLDEVREEDYVSVLRKIHSFVAGHPNCTIAIASRPSGFILSDWVNCSIYEIEPLAEPNIIAYINAWFDNEKSKQLFEKLQHNDRLFDLARTPFLLAMICLIYEHYGNVEKRRSSLYRKCTEYLNGLRDWDSQRNKTNVSNNSIKLFDLREAILRTIAFHFFQLQKSEFNQEELEFVVQRALPNHVQLKFKEILQQIYKQSGVLQQAGDSVYFIHRTIFEYYVACAMLEQDQDSLLDWASNPKYEEPFRLYAGLLQNAAQKDDLIRGLWQRNPPLALLSCTEMDDFPDERISSLLDSINKAERLRMMRALESSLSYLPKQFGLRFTMETIQVVFPHEKNCEILWWGMQLLQRIDPEDQKRILWLKFDCDAKERRNFYLADLRYKFEFVQLSGGTFTMGDDLSYNPSEKPAHKVKVRQFSIGRFPVTNIVWREFPFRDDQKHAFYMNKDSHPVGIVNWYEAVIFCRWLGCRLPTEAEWEYACRAGTTTQYYFGDDPKELEMHAWFSENSSKDSHPVGQKNSNAWGLFDMTGNVWEWCSDWYDDVNYYKLCEKEKITINPQGPHNGDRKVVRGGGFVDPAIILRSSSRFGIYPDFNGNNDVGFRVALSDFNEL